MSDPNMKCVMVIDAELPLGLVANTSAVLGMTLGKHLPEQVGTDVMDASEQIHLGITTVPFSMLRGDKEMLKDLRERLYGEEFSDLLVVDFTDVAQCCNTYDDYTAKAAITSAQDILYFGIAIYGNKKKVNKLTGSMPLLR